MSETMQAAAEIEWPKYKCHKTVQACRVDQMLHSGDDGRNVRLVLDTGRVWETTKYWCVQKGVEVGGYLVRYEDGYVSFSPRVAFDNGYELVGQRGPGPEPQRGQRIGWAIDALVFDGAKVRREPWPVGQFVVRQKGYPDGIPINANTAEATGLAEGTLCRFLPYLMVYLPAAQAFVPWVAHHYDQLATDWELSP